MMFSENILQNNFSIRDFAISVQNENRTNLDTFWILDIIRSCLSLLYCTKHIVADTVDQNILWLSFICNSIFTFSSVLKQNVL